jgi:hypothetical protein
MDDSMVLTGLTRVFGTVQSVASLIASLRDRFVLLALGQCSKSMAVSLFAALLFTACGDHRTSGSNAKSPDASATDIQSTVNNLRMPASEPNAPFLPLSGVVLDGLSAEMPELSKARDAVLAVESGAIQGLIADMRAKSRSTTKVGSASQELHGEQLSSKRMPRAPAPAAHLIEDLIPAAVADEPVYSSLGHIQLFAIGHQVGSLIGAGISNVGASDSGSKTANMPGEGNGTVDVSLTVSAKPGTPPSGELTTKVSLPLFLLDANSKVVITGDLCPNPDGKVDFSIKLSTDGRGGSGASVIYDQNIEARVVATVNDDANVVNVDYDMKQATRSTAGGRQVYVESTQSASGPPHDAKFSEGKVIRASSQANASDTQLAQEGIVRSYLLAFGALESAREYWQGGNCIRIDAAAPGKVAPGATSRIPVAVTNKKDGSAVPAKVAVTLTGGASVSPVVIPKSPGEVVHVASGERRAKMTISLTATSRRGKATSDLNVSTGGAYSADGGGTGLKITGAIDSIERPYVLSGVGQGFTLELSYTPTTASGSAGTMTYRGQGGGVSLAGGGAYTVDGIESGAGPLTLTAKPTGCVDGPSIHNCRQTVEIVTLTPTN